MEQGFRLECLEEIWQMGYGLKIGWARELIGKVSFNQGEGVSL